MKIRRKLRAIHIRAVSGIYRCFNGGAQTNTSGLRNYILVPSSTAKRVVGFVSARKIVASNLVEHG
jgi:hypothetical protein